MISFFYKVRFCVSFSIIFITVKIFFVLVVVFKVSFMFLVTNLTAINFLCFIATMWQCLHSLEQKRN